MHASCASATRVCCGIVSLNSFVDQCACEGGVDECGIIMDDLEKGAVEIQSL